MPHWTPIQGKNLEFAFNLMNRYSFDIKHSDSPDVNPEGDIVLSAAWSDKLVETLIQMAPIQMLNFIMCHLRTGITSSMGSERKSKFSTCVNEI